MSSQRGLLPELDGAIRAVIQFRDANIVAQGKTRCEKEVDEGRDVRLFAAALVNQDAETPGVRKAHVK